MKKRFIVALDSSTKEQNDMFKEYIDHHGLGWWHWIKDFWLLIDSKGYLTARELRDELGKIYPGVYKMVLELRSGDDTWSGYGLAKEDRNMFDWLRKYW
jgi:hypothetical protein